MGRVKVLFVCMGNICRSPTAHGVFRELVEKAGLSGVIEVDSAVREFLDDLERDLKEAGEKEIPSHDIGEKVMEKLHNLNDIAYVRFASVYREFKDVNDFVSELRSLLSSQKS